MAHITANPTALRAMAELVAHATIALDGRENSMAWLQQPNKAMGGRTPFDILAGGDPAEIEQLEQQLSALEHGIYP